MKYEFHSLIPVSNIYKNKQFKHGLKTLELSKLSTFLINIINSNKLITALYSHVCTSATYKVGLPANNQLI